MEHTYHCKNLSSGNVYLQQFTGKQHTAFYDVDGIAPRALRKIKDDLIARWNKQQPNEWLYWMD